MNKVLNNILLVYNKYLRYFSLERKEKSANYCTPFTGIQSLNDIPVETDVVP